MKNLLILFLTSIVNGVTAQAEINYRTAADGRHPPFITSFLLPASHIAWPEGTIMVAGANPGEAVAASTPDADGIIGVLNRRVDADEQSGNIVIHGSCPAEILKYVDGGELVDATAAQIAALRTGIGIYV